MEILSGQLLINEVDVYITYGAFLCEERDGEQKNFDSLLKHPRMKPRVAVNIREKNGEKLPTKLLTTYEARDIDLYFAIVAPSSALFLTRYYDFIKFLRTGTDGWLTLAVAQMNRTYRVFLSDFSQYGQITPFEGEVAARFTCVFREPEPLF